MVTGSVNEDVSQLSQPNMKGLNALVTGGAQLRLFFGVWSTSNPKPSTHTVHFQRELSLGVALQQRLLGPENPTCLWTPHTNPQPLAKWLLWYTGSYVVSVLMAFGGLYKGLNALVTGGAQLRLFFGVWSTPSPKL